MTLEARLPSGTVNFADGEATQDITIDVSGDTVLEPDQGFTVSLNSPSSPAIIVTGNADGTILNDDPVPLTITNEDLFSSYFEDTGQVNLTIRRGGSTSEELIVDVSVDKPGDVGVPATITFEPGSDTATLVAVPVRDVIDELDEGFTITVGTNGLTTRPTFSGTILDDDTSSVSVTVSPTPVSEDGIEVLTYTFTRDKASSESPAMTVGFTTTGSATMGTDFTQAVSGSVAFAAGESIATVTVDPQPDLLIEPNETVVLTVSPGTNYSIGAR